MDTPELFSFQQSTWTITELNRYMRQQLESDYRLQDLWITGEVSNLSHPASGHLYFSLRDDEAALRCVMWRHLVSKQPEIPQNGDSIELHGYISIYEAGGTLQFYADRIRPTGEGALFLEFMRLKEKLEAEGLFDSEKKRPLPAWPHRMGVVTSPTAAALQDVLNVLRRRCPFVEVILSPTTVQGERAPAEIIAAIERLNIVSEPDVILLVRGGGSMEDLWAFNEEGVVRAAAASKAPVVSGIGHENDLILCDFAADVRAPTPSAAAELATPDRAELQLDLSVVKRSLQDAFDFYLQRQKLGINQARTKLQLFSPRARVNNARQIVDSLQQRTLASIQHEVEIRKTHVAGKAQTLNAVGPPAVLDRGYAIVANTNDGAIVRSVEQVSEGNLLDVRVADGSFKTRVTNPEKPGQKA